MAVAITLATCSRCGFGASELMLQGGLCNGCGGTRIPRENGVHEKAFALPPGAVLYKALKNRVAKRGLTLPRWISRKVFRAGYIQEADLPDRFRRSPRQTGGKG